MKGCLLIHGFTGSPEEVLPLAEHLRQVTNWEIRTPTLPGHGENESLAEVSWRDWKCAVERECEAMLSKGAEVDVVGFSMGGLLAAHLASRYPIERLVLLSTAVFAPHPQQIIADLKTLFQQAEKKDKALANDLQRYREKVKNTPIRAVFQFRKLVKNVLPAIEHIDVPVLIVQGQKDNIVKPKSAEYIFENVRSTERGILYLPNSKHLVCHDCEQEELFQAIEKFLCRRKVSL